MMQGKTHYANGQPIFRQTGKTLTYFFMTGLKKAEGESVDGVMQGGWRFWRETGELWQVGHFRDGLKHGEWLRYARDHDGINGRTHRAHRCAHRGRLVQPHRTRCHISMVWCAHAIRRPSGGGFVETWADGGRTVTTTGEVRFFEPPHRLDLSWRDEDWPAATTVSITLEPVDEITRLCLRHDGWAALGAGAAALAEVHRRGWAAHLGALRRYAEALCQHRGGEPT